jgi:hypothetical protein
MTVPRRTYPLRLRGELAEHRVVVDDLTTRELIALRAGELDEQGLAELIGRHLVESDLGQDPLDWPVWVLAEVIRAWGEAITVREEEIVPPPTAEP